MANNEQVPIKVFGSKEAYAEKDSDFSGRIESIIRQNVLGKRDASYHEVKVKVRRDTYGEPKYLVAYLLRNDVYSAEVVRVDLGAGMDAETITFDYEEPDDADEDEEPPDYESFDQDGFPSLDDQDFAPDQSMEAYDVDFVVATPVEDIPSAVEAVNQIYNMAREVGLRAVKLVGEQASIANYKRYLTSGVRGFVNIGHGNPNLIVLADGTLNNNWFSTLTNRPLAPSVAYFNSCKVFNDPLKTSVLQAGSRTFVGGIVNLLIGPSEDVCVCFWHSQFTSTVDMRKALVDCENSKYPNEGAHGIGGNTGRFDVERMRLAHSMWTHGVSAQIENPERLNLDKRYGFFARFRGKPFTSTWVHFAIPTPAIIDGKRLNTGAALLRYRTGPGASIGAVHVWDAERRRIATHNNLSLTSSGSGFRMTRLDVPMRPAVYFGIVVSISLKFGDDANLPANKLLVDLSAVGCDFMLPSQMPVILPVLPVRPA